MKPLVLLVALLCMQAYASPHVGIIVKITGKAELFTNPAPKAKGPGPHILFEGETYQLKKMRLGLRVDNNNVVRTGSGSKVRIVFKNGDQYNIGENTAYRVSWSTDPKLSKKKGSVINLMYGKLRAVVSKKGARKNLQIKTRTASMGIRGTDFFVDKNGNLGNLNVSVMRGEVEVKVQTTPTKVEEIKKTAKGETVVKEAPKTEIFKVKSGFTASVKEEPSKDLLAKLEKATPKKKAQILKRVAPQVEVKLEQTSKQEFVKIQKTSTIKTKPEEEKEQQKVTSKKVAAEVQKLEKKAVETTLDDIKEYDPKLHKQLKEDKVKDVVAINSTVVKKLFKRAPDKPLKPGDEILDELDEDAYSKYFDTEDL